jgi:hypothetical protein
MAKFYYRGMLLEKYETALAKTEDDWKRVV